MGSFDLQMVASLRRLAGFCAEQSERPPARKQSSTILAWVMKALESKLADGDLDDDEVIVVGGVLLFPALRAPLRP